MHQSTTNGVKSKTNEPLPAFNFLILTLMYLTDKLSCFLGAFQKWLCWTEGGRPCDACWPRQQPWCWS